MGGGGIPYLQIFFGFGTKVPSVLVRPESPSAVILGFNANFGLFGLCLGVAQEVAIPIHTNVRA